MNEKRADKLSGDNMYRSLVAHLMISLSLVFLVGVFASSYARAGTAYESGYDNGGYERQVHEEVARAKDFRRHIIADEKFEAHRDEGIEAYKLKKEHQSAAHEKEREAYVKYRENRPPDLSDQELARLEKAREERERREYEKKREAYVIVRNHADKAQVDFSLNENEEYGL